jgi:hypothetical protein
MSEVRKEYLFASKLAALTTRSSVVTRDIYDIHYFAKNNWEPDPEVIKIRTGKSVKAYLKDCISAIKSVNQAHMLQGLGELVGEKEKNRIRQDLKNDTVFLLKNYESVL